MVPYATLSLHKGIIFLLNHFIQDTKWYKSVAKRLEHHEDWFFISQIYFIAGYYKCFMQDTNTWKCRSSTFSNSYTYIYIYTTAASLSSLYIYGMNWQAGENHLFSLHLHYTLLVYTSLRRIESNALYVGVGCWTNRGCELPVCEYKVGTKGGRLASKSLLLLLLLLLYIYVYELEKVDDLHFQVFVHCMKHS